ncbi:hypothetical protein QN277_008960 [Acacia crassicarpa]|uniref:SRP54-type proteins GTP-binding domain-containing protein n=1 Tax=Acacia crassicarpa TaxID=499986 RepID=A0AAE1M8Q9_9FABA|nr:hypothetical protein QN277_008960 [Acacia crassicarpa]
MLLSLPNILNHFLSITTLFFLSIITFCQILDGTTGLNKLPQAHEFNDVVGVTGLILTKLDGSARGGCVVSVVEELGIPVKFVGVGEGVEDLQPFDAEAFVDAIFT